MITGTVVIALEDLPAERMKARCAAIEHAPQGARVVLVVGACKPEPEAIEYLWRRAENYVLDVHGTPAAVTRWVDALRAGPEALL